MRLAGLLVEGAGEINTSGCADSDGVLRSPAGPIEVQAFLQDLFTGPTTTTPIRGNLPVQPIPANLPQITLTQVDAASPLFQQIGFTNTGSLVTPDVTFPVPPAAQVVVDLSMTTQLVPDGTSLTVRAVATDGTAATVVVPVSLSSAVAQLTLNAGTTYQIVVTPSTPFALSRRIPNALELAGRRDPASTLGLRSKIESKLESTAEEMLAAGASAAKIRERQIAEQWLKAFGVSTEAPQTATMEDSGPQYIGAL